MVSGMIWEDPEQGELGFLQELVRAAGLEWRRRWGQGSGWQGGEHRLDHAVSHWDVRFF